MRDLINRRFGQLTVIARQEQVPGHRTSWLCRCDCGKERILPGGSLNNHRKSCGCLMIGARFKIKHGMSRTDEYDIWFKMLDRCNNPQAHNYHHYGGRGIKVCPEWHKFGNFYKDMCPRPPGLSIDRINNNGHYMPSNCRWATHRQQAINRRKALGIVRSSGVSVEIKRELEALAIKRGLTLGEITRYAIVKLLDEERLKSAD